MKIETRDEMFRCEHAMCKNFASKEIVIGGYKKGMALCSDHYLELISLIKQDNKNSREKLYKNAMQRIVE